MMEIEFTHESEMIADARAERVWEQPWREIWEKYLFVAARLRVTGVDLLSCESREHPGIPGYHTNPSEILIRGHTPCPWAVVRLIDYVCKGWWAVNAAYAWGEATQFSDDASRIDYERSGELMTVRSYYGRGTVSVVEARAAWRRAVDDARTYLRSEIPELLTHPEVGPWLQGEMPLARPPLDDDPEMPE